MAALSQELAINSSTIDAHGGVTMLPHCVAGVEFCERDGPRVFWCYPGLEWFGDSHLEVMVMHRLMKGDHCFTQLTAQPAAAAGAILPPLPSASAAPSPAPPPSVSRYVEVIVPNIAPSPLGPIDVCGIISSAPDSCARGFTRTWGLVVFSRAAMGAAPSRSSSSCPQPQRSRWLATLRPVIRAVDAKLDGRFRDELRLLFLALHAKVAAARLKEPTEPLSNHEKLVAIRQVEELENIKATCLKHGVDINLPQEEGIQRPLSVSDDADDLVSRLMKKGSQRLRSLEELCREEWTDCTTVMETLLIETAIRMDDCFSSIEDMARAFMAFHSGSSVAVYVHRVVPSALDFVGAKALESTSSSAPLPTGMSAASIRSRTTVAAVPPKSTPLSVVLARAALLFLSLRRNKSLTFQLPWTLASGEPPLALLWSDETETLAALPPHYCFLLPTAVAGGGIRSHRLQFVPSQCTARWMESVTALNMVAKPRLVRAHTATLDDAVLLYKQAFHNSPQQHVSSRASVADSEDPSGSGAPPSSASGGAVQQTAAARPASLRIFLDVCKYVAARTASIDAAAQHIDSGGVTRLLISRAL